MCMDVMTLHVHRSWPPYRDGYSRWRAQGVSYMGMEATGKRKHSPVHIGVVAAANIPRGVLVICVPQGSYAVFVPLCRHGQNFSGLLGGPGVTAG